MLIVSPLQICDKIQLINPNNGRSLTASLIQFLFLSYFEIEINRCGLASTIILNTVA